MTRFSLPSGLIYDDSQVPPGLIAQDLRYVVQAVTETVLVSGINVTLGQIVTCTLTANRVMGAPVTPVIGQWFMLVITQGGAGGFTLTFNAALKFTWSETGNTTGKVSTIAGVFVSAANWRQLGAQTAYQT